MISKCLLCAGSISYRHKFIDMTRVIVEASNFTQPGKTCPAAMGFSFAAGTTDGETLQTPTLLLTGLVEGCVHTHL